jgi:hypothetical protein
MSKRFLDTSIWERPWFMDLGVADKMAVMYLFAKCDAVGVWVPNYKLANFQLGADVDWEALLGKCNGNIEVLENGKWWVVDFCKFQYGELVGTNNAHRSYLSLLRKHGLEDEFQGLTRGCQAPIEKEKEKDIDKDKDKDKDKIKSERAPCVLLTTSEHDKLVEKYGADNTKAAYNKLSVSKQANGYKYKSDYHAILNWVMDEVVKKAKGEGPRTATPGWECAKCHRVNHNTGGVCLCGEVREVPA